VLHCPSVAANLLPIHRLYKDNHFYFILTANLSL